MSKLGFDWKEFSLKLGYKKPPSTFICGSLNYLKCISKILKDNWNTPKWRSYWYYIFLRQIIRFDKKLRTLHYEFNGKFITGTSQKFPQELYPIFGLSATFNTYITNEYVNKYWNEPSVNYVKTMAEDLLAVFKRIITRNTWLSPEAKKNGFT
jgi:predicted metalloendopeptidase